MVSTSPAAVSSLGQHLHDDAVEALVFLPLDGAGAIDALDEHFDVAIGQLEALDDIGDAAHRVDVVRLRVVDGRVVLRGQEDPLVLHQRMLERAVEDGRPITNGIIMCGKTTTSRSGTMGRVS